jgi:hypothetical protein
MRVKRACRASPDTSVFDPLRTSAGSPEIAARRGQALPEPTASCYGSGLATGEDILLDDRVDAPISINHLGDAEVDANRN